MGRFAFFGLENKLFFGSVGRSEPVVPACEGELEGVESILFHPKLQKLHI